MAQQTKISWTDSTFNPWVGCSKVSGGCKNCYAETLMDTHYQKAKWGVHGTRVPTSESYWKKPLAWNKDRWFECKVCGWRGAEYNFSGADCPGCGEIGTEDNRRRVRQRVFCASLADVFEGPESMPESEWDRLIPIRWRLFELITQTPNLEWLLLTKRPENVMEHINTFANWYGVPPANVWIGTTVEDQASADERIPILCSIPAKVRFLSCEPLLGPVNLGLEGILPGHKYLAVSDKIDWVIGGGESGTGARACHSDWARGLRDQCQQFNIPFHWKQWGEWLPSDQYNASGMKGQMVQAGREIFGGKANLRYDFPEGGAAHRVGKHDAGRYLDGKTWDCFPEV